MGPPASARVHVQAVVLDGRLRGDRIPVPGRIGHPSAPVLPAERGLDPDGMRTGDRYSVLAGGLVLDVLHHPLHPDGVAAPVDPSLRRLRHDLPDVRPLLPGLLSRGLQGPPRVLLDGRDPPDARDPRHGVHGLPSPLHADQLQRHQRRDRARHPTPRARSGHGAVHHGGRDASGTVRPHVRGPCAAPAARARRAALRPHRAVRVARDRSAVHLGSDPAPSVYREGGQGARPVHASHLLLHDASGPCSISASYSE